MNDMTRLQAMAGGVSKRPSVLGKTIRFQVSGLRAGVSGTFLASKTFQTPA
jgi:hypothetical protein